MNKKSCIATIRGHSFYAGSINRNSVIVDLGAHKGEFSSNISSRFGCKCYLVEALPALFSQIADGPLVKKYNFVMAGRDESVELFVSQNLEGSTIINSAATRSHGTVIVDGVTLDTFMTRAGIDAIDLLKIDIEGAEIELLESASDAILSNIKQITVEFHNFLPGVVSTHQVAEIKKRLQDLGFYAIKFSRTLNTDVLFINKKHYRISNTEYWYIKYIIKNFCGLTRLFQRLYQKKY
jgi:FkbM family methyltransferase